MTANYYGMISLIDHNVGRILAALDDLGLERDTLVVYTTDHGELLGNHGLYLKHPIPYEDLLRVTLVARGPGVAAGRVVARAGLHARSRADLLRLRRRAGAARACRAGACGSCSAARPKRATSPTASGTCIRRAAASACSCARCARSTHKCTFDLGSGAGELYDLANDPGEMDNRYDDPGCAKVQKELHDMMRARPGAVRSDLAEPVGMA